MKLATHFHIVLRSKMELYLHSPCLHGMVLNWLGTGTTLPLPSTIFWCVTLCSLVEVYWHFRGMYCLHLQGVRVSKGRKCHAASIHSLCFLLACCLLGLLFGPEDGGSLFLQNVSKPLPYYTASAQNTVIFMVTSMRTLSNKIEFLFLCRMRWDLVMFISCKKDILFVCEIVEWGWKLPNSVLIIPLTQISWDSVHQICSNLATT
jgi:hypothetical protein